MYKWEINGKNDTLILFRRFLKSIYRRHTIDRKIIPTSEMVKKRPAREKRRCLLLFALQGVCCDILRFFRFLCSDGAIPSEET